MSELPAIERYFRVISYLVALTGLFALFASGGVGVIVVTLFVFATVFAWKLEDSRWQLSERLALTFVVVSIIAFVADWRLGFSGAWNGGFFAASGLARLILFLCAIKLLQKKKDKDWIFIYVISFFEVLLAAGLSISPLYLISLFTFLLAAISAIVAFEIRRSARLEVPESRKKVVTGIMRVSKGTENDRYQIRRLPYASVMVLALITIVGLPIFFSLPRGNASAMGNNFASPINVTGFSDSVELGSIGNLQQSDAIVMRVRIDQNNNPDLTQLLWKGVALDRFDNKSWKKSRPFVKQPFATNFPQRMLQIDRSPRLTKDITVQSFFIEPMSTNVLFGLNRPFGIKGQKLINRDSEGALLNITSGVDRFSYTLFSDTGVPRASVLRKDDVNYPEEFDRYLQLPPNMDLRIGRLAETYIEDAKATNAYDMAVAIENRLQSDFGYTLEMKASGPQPVADFLFRVREGHCEYFASAMAIMLRSQGIATRVVNGFQGGDFNSSAGVYVVRQQNAHSWVEVYFPETQSWVAFNPTPAAGNPSGQTSLFSSLRGFSEALETFWIQYVVAYDGQEQSSLFKRFRDRAAMFASSSATYMAFFKGKFEEILKDINDDAGFVAGAKIAIFGIGIGLALLVFIWFGRKAWKFVLRWSFVRKIVGEGKQKETAVAFYREMTDTLSKGGYERSSSQTPLEFAESIGNESAVLITNLYHQVRFGKKDLTSVELEILKQSLGLIQQFVSDSSKSGEKSE